MGNMDIVMNAYALPAWMGLWILLGVFHGQLWAHSDPTGDVHPQVKVSTGQFVVTFYSNIQTRNEGARNEDEERYRMIFSTEGKPLLPRFRARLSPEEIDEFSWETRFKRPAVMMTAGEAGERRCFLRSSTTKGAVEVPLPLSSVGWSPFGNPNIRADATALLAPCAAFVWAEQPRGGVEAPYQLHFGLASRQGFAEGTHLILGDVATIYNFARVSQPVWADGRWWMVWMQMGNSEPKLKAMLTSYDPDKKKLISRALAEEGVGNTSISLATTNGWLCAAWHTDPRATQSFASSRIVTVFRRIADL